MKMQLTIVLLSALASLCVALKYEWPELVGKTGKEAQAQINNDRPDVVVDILREGSIAMEDSADYMTVFVNEKGIVVSTPRIGVRLDEWFKVWPELVGKTGEQAKAQILKERPDLFVEILPDDDNTTSMRDDRVRIFVNKKGIVTEEPYIG